MNLDIMNELIYCAKNQKHNSYFVTIRKIWLYWTSAEPINSNEEGITNDKFCDHSIIVTRWSIHRLKKKDFEGGIRLQTIGPES